MTDTGRKTGADKTKNERKNVRDRQMLAFLAWLVSGLFVIYRLSATFTAVTLALTIALTILALASLIPLALVAISTCFFLWLFSWSDLNLLTLELLFTKLGCVLPYIACATGLTALGLSLVIMCKTSRPTKRMDNPYRNYVGSSGWLDARIDRLIAWFGTLKYFTSPLVIVEEPGAYKVKGHEVRELIDGPSDRKLQPGDILLRGYDGYVDGELIKLSGGAQGMGKYFSHAAIYLGEVTHQFDKDDNEPIAARRLKVLDENGVWRDAWPGEKEAVRNNPEYFRTGSQMVIHAMTKGVFVEDILTFLRCDYVAVLRLDEIISLGASEFDADELVSLKGSDAAEKIRDCLKNGGAVNRSQIIELVLDSALGRIGSCYDFQFTDCKTFHRFSCSEFAYYCYKSIHGYLGLHPKKHAFMGSFFARDSITPGDIYDAAVRGNKFKIVWQSSGVV